MKMLMMAAFGLVIMSMVSLEATREEARARAEHKSDVISGQLLAYQRAMQCFLQEAPDHDGAIQWAEVPINCHMLGFGAPVSGLGALVFEGQLYVYIDERDDAGAARRLFDRVRGSYTMGIKSVSADGHHYLKRPAGQGERGADAPAAIPNGALVLLGRG